MPNGNPFLIKPSQATSSTLTGLADTMLQAGRLREERKAREGKEEAIRKTEARIVAIRQGAQKAFASGDINQMRQFSIANPEFSKVFSDIIQFKNKRTKQNYIDSLMSVYTDPSPENVQRVAQERQDFLRMEGVPPEQSKETDTFVQRTQGRPPEEIKKIVGMDLATLLTDEQFKNFQSAVGEKAALKPTADIQNFEYFQNLEKTDPAKAAQFAAAALDTGGGAITGENALVAKSLGIDPGAEITQVDAGKILGKKAKMAMDKKGGFFVQTNPDGSTTVMMGPGAGKDGAAGFQRSTKGQLEQKEITTGESLMRLREIKEGFRPEFLEYGTKIKGTLIAFKEKFGFNASPEEKALLEDMSAWMATSYNNLNLYIKDITGVAMSAEEAKRIEKGIGNPQKDSPTQFMSKTDRAIKHFEAMQTRLQYIRNRGLSFKESTNPKSKNYIDYKNIPRIMNERGMELVEEYGLSFDDADKQLAEEFGLYK